MRELILIGGGGHCRSCIDVIKQEAKYSIKGIIDVPEKIGNSLDSYPYIGTDEDIPKLALENTDFLITLGHLGDAEKRIRCYNTIKDSHGTMATVISPRAYVSKSATIGEGTIILHDALINTGAVIGYNCIINSKALIEHDAIIEEQCHISTGSIINGSSSIGFGSFIGSHATIIQGVSCKPNSFIKAGSVFKGAI